MKDSLKKICLLVLISLFLFVFAQIILGFQTPMANAAQLRKNFMQVAGKDFEIVRDEMRRRPRDTASDYWLVYIKPKRSGFYSLKYTYKFTKKWSEYSSDEGENEFSISVGGKECFRRNQIQNGISSYCLGDTIIIPILLTNMKDHAFSLNFRQQETEGLAQSQKYYKSRENYSPVEPVFNELKTNVKLLGTKRFEIPHRSCCAVKVEDYAIFEAIKTGRFNLGLSSFTDAETPPLPNVINANNGIPIIIVAPETPITALLPAEKTIHYADNRRFSAHAGNNFITDLLIVQPGDIFALRYAERTFDYKIGTKRSEIKEIPDIKPAIYKLPFLLNKSWSFNEWLVDVLPKVK